MCVCGVCVVCVWLIVMMLVFVMVWVIDDLFDSMSISFPFFPIDELFFVCGYTLSLCLSLSLSLSLSLTHTHTRALWHMQTHTGCMAARGQIVARMMFMCVYVCVYVF